MGVGTDQPDFSRRSIDLQCFSFWLSHLVRHPLPNLAFATNSRQLENLSENLGE